MELEFRNSRGECLFSLLNELAERTFYDFLKVPEFVLTNKTLTKSGVTKTYKVFVCVEECGYTLSGMVSFVLKKGDYIKILQ